VLVTILVTGACTAYILWKIDVGETAHVVGHANVGYFLLALGIMNAAVWPLAWRWQRLLEARSVREGLPWLIRTYFVSYMAGNVLPTSLGGDATRIYEASRRHPEASAKAAASVLLERALGGVATLLLAAVGFSLAIGRYDVGPYLWVEGAFVVGAVAAGVVLFSTSMRRPLARTIPALRRVRLERPLRAVYEGVHAYRRHVRVLLAMLALTVVVQGVRILSVWLAGRAVGVDLSPRPYYVMGPMLFLVMLVPFTINGFAVREAFFVSFLTRLGVGSDPAFATGFLFFVMSAATGLPGAVILAWESLRPRRATALP
jgi:glycosyltransferase 2 family protein